MHDRTDIENKLADFLQSLLALHTVETSYELAFESCRVVTSPRGAKVGVAIYLKFLRQLPKERQPGEFLHLYDLAVLIHAAFCFPICIVYVDGMRLGMYSMEHKIYKLF